MTSNRLSAVARAKINLALHVVGRTRDGFHLLDSLVCFCDYGDQIELKPIQPSQSDVSLFDLAIDLEIKGVFANSLGNIKENLIFKAANMLATCLKSQGLTCSPVQIILEKNLPVASGIGGGSADAAAVLNLLLKHWVPENRDLQHNIDLSKIALQLGADVPMCLNPEPKKIGGIGEIIHSFPAMPSLDLVLVNSGDFISTPEIFRDLDNKNNPKIDIGSSPQVPSLTKIVNFLANQRNDLQPVATKFSPAINTVIAKLEAQQDCLLARMSGSGATCFGIFNNSITAKKAAKNIQEQNPAWWTVATKSVSGSGAFTT